MIYKKTMQFACCTLPNFLPTTCGGRVPIGDLTEKEAKQYADFIRGELIAHARRKREQKEKIEWLTT